MSNASEGSPAAWYGNLATQTRAGVTTTWQRDTWGAPTFVTVPASGSTFTYDRMDPMTQDRIAGSGGQLITWPYDEAGNVTGGGPRPASRTYDVNNRMVTEGTAVFQ